MESKLKIQYFGAVRNIMIEAYTVRFYKRNFRGNSRRILQDQVLNFSLLQLIHGF